MPTSRNRHLQRGGIRCIGIPDCTTMDAGESYRTVADILGNSEATLRLHYDGRTGVDKRKAVTALEL
jgi:hypothetical protein